MAAIETGQKLRELLSTDLSGIVLDYREVYALQSGWRFLPSFDHPEHTACCLVSGCANAHGAIIYCFSCRATLVYERQRHAPAGTWRAADDSWVR